MLFRSQPVPRASLSLSSTSMLSLKRNDRGGASSGLLRESIGPVKGRMMTVLNGEATGQDGIPATAVIPPIADVPVILRALEQEAPNTCW